MNVDELAHSLVDGFFIGGSDDSLENPDLTKGDLHHALKMALEKAYNEGLQDGRKGSAKANA